MRRAPAHSVADFRPHSLLGSADPRKNKEAGSQREVQQRDTAVAPRWTTDSAVRFVLGRLMPRRRRNSAEKSQSSSPAGDQCGKDKKTDDEELTPGIGQSPLLRSRRTAGKKKNVHSHMQSDSQADIEMSGLSRDEGVNDVVFGRTLAAATAENRRARIKRVGSLGNYADQLGTKSGTSTMHIWATLAMLFVGLICSAVSFAMAFYSDWDEVAWGDGRVFRWVGWLALFIGSIPVFYWMVRTLFRCVLARLVSVNIWYWLRGLSLSFVGMFWSITNWVSLRFVLPTADAPTSACDNSTGSIDLPRATTPESLVLRWMEPFFLAVIVVCAFRMVKVILAKHFVTKAHSGAFWDQIRNSLSLERMLEILGVAGYNETDFKELGLDRETASAGAASFWQGVNQVLKQPRISGKFYLVHENENLLSHRQTSDGPASFADMDRYEQTLLADAQFATREIWKICSAHIPPDPAESASPLPVLTEETLLTSDKFASAFYQPRHRRHLPAGDDQCSAQILSWWEMLDLNAHDGPFVALKPGGDVAEQCSHLSPDSVDHALTFPEVVNILQRMFQKRESLYNTLHDREGISNVLNRMIDVVFWLLMMIVVPIALGFDVSQLILPMGSFVLGLAFVFGNSLKEAWESILFLFSTRPFNIGDRITLGVAGEYPSMFVRKIGLLEIEFQAVDGRSIMIRTHQVRGSVIVQYARSRDFACDMAMQVSINTPSSVIETMARRIREWAKNDRDRRGVPWQHTSMIFWVNKADPAQNTMTLCLWLELHGITWNQPAYYLPLRGDLWKAWVEICRGLNIAYEQPLQPVLLDCKKAIRRISDKFDPDSKLKRHSLPLSTALHTMHSVDITSSTSSDDDSFPSCDAS